MKAPYILRLEGWRAVCPLRLWRKQQHWTRGVAAAALGVTKETIKNWENGSHGLHNDSMGKVRSVAGADVADRYVHWLKKRRPKAPRVGDGRK